jgi:outer membrane protein assembly factor BamB
VVWKYQADDKLHATPAIADGQVLIGGCDRQLHVVRLSDGGLQRRIDLGSVTGSSAAVRGPRAFLGTHGEQVLGVDWTEGAVAWSFRDEEKQFPYMASPAATDELVVIGGRDKRIRALDAKSGPQRWVFKDARGRIDSSPVIVGRRVFIGGGDGVLYELDLETGRERSRFEAGGPISASPAVAGGRLVIGTLDGVVYCLGGR